MRFCPSWTHPTHALTRHRKPHRFRPGPSRSLTAKRRIRRLAAWSSRTSSVAKKFQSPPANDQCSCERLAKMRAAQSASSFRFQDGVVRIDHMPAQAGQSRTRFVRERDRVLRKLAESGRTSQRLARIGHIGTKPGRLLLRAQALRGSTRAVDGVGDASDRCMNIRQKFGARVRPPGR